MNSRTNQFLEYFKSIAHEKTALNALLKADNKKALAYYIAPIENIIKIYQRGGILPRKFVHSSVDVSSTIVQELREKLVFFPEQKRIVELHKCVNLFINPINDTLFHFRRNALIQKNTRIGILEIDLESLLSRSGMDWEIFPQNFIKDYSNSQVGYMKFPWSNIYTLTTNRNRTANQSAEIIVHMTFDLIAIPNEDIRRVIFFENDILTKPDNLGYPLEIIDNPNHYSALQDPLDYDRKFLKNLFSITDQGEMSDSLIDSLQRLKNVEDEIGLTLIENYQNQDVALGQTHGIGHTIRVMFWVLFLSSRLFLDNPNAITEDEVTASLYAAFIHDLCRQNNQIDNYHGSSAAEKYSPHLECYQTKPTLDRCLFAVKVHSMPQDPKLPDVIWYLLKDADAIDRSRFGRPEIENGCQKKYLRLKCLRKDPIFTNSILWTSYFFSRMTNYINWKEYSCSDFVVTMLGSLQATANSPITPPDHKELANKIVRGMSSN